VSVSNYDLSLGLSTCLEVCFTNKAQMSMYSFFRPMTILLECCATANDLARNNGVYQGLEDDIEWILDTKMILPDPVDTSITSLQMWSFYSLLAEICLNLANRLSSSNEKRSALIEEGIRLSSLADPKMKDIDGNIINPVAYSPHSRIYSELQGLGNLV